MQIQLILRRSNPVKMSVTLSRGKLCLLALATYLLVSGQNSNLPKRGVAAESSLRILQQTQANQTETNATLQQVEPRQHQQRGAALKLQLELEPIGDGGGGETSGQLDSARRQQEQLAATGSAILEDLVNQFKRNMEFELAASGERRLEELANQTSATVTLVDENELANGENQSASIGDSYSLPHHLPTPAPVVLETSGADLIVESEPLDSDDQHIQYDVVQKSSTDELDELQRRSSDYKLPAEFAASNSSAAFELGLVRIGDQSAAAGAPIEAARDEAALADEAANSTLTVAAAAEGATGARTSNLQPRSMASVGNRVAALSAHSKPPYAATYSQLRGEAAAELADATPQANQTDYSSVSARSQPKSAAPQSDGVEIRGEVVSVQKFDGKPIGKQTTKATASDESIRQKLAPPSESIELSPIPQRNEPDEAKQQPVELSERFFQSAGGSVQSPNFVRAPAQPNDRYANFETGGYSLSEPANSLASAFGPAAAAAAAAPVSHLQLDKPHDSRGGAPDSSTAAPSSGGLQRYQVHEPPQQQQVLRKTFSTIGSQLENSEHRERHASPPQQPFGGSVRQHSGSMAPPGGGGARYAASLLNVTAPILQPLSASEAMEASAQHLHLRPPTGASYLSHQRPVAVASTPHYLNDEQLSGAGSERHRLDLPPPTSAAAAADYLNSGKPSYLAAPAHQHHVASGFRSPSYPQQLAAPSPTTSLPAHLSYLNSLMPSGPIAASQQSESRVSSLPQLSQQAAQQQQQPAARPQQVVAANVTTSQVNKSPTSTTSTSALATTTPASEFITGSVTNATNPIQASNEQIEPTNGQQNAATKRPSMLLNLTRVEHISAECSNDLIRTVIIFNGTFKGIIYSAGYVRDPNCLYINGTGKTRYDFSIKLNQCGTLGRQELHPPSGPNEIRRRDQVMWNTLSIQYNPIIEQEWDEHFRVSCEYGSDFWKTVSFSPFNVETNTGSPVVFTVDPPQCQMEILRGHGMVGPRQEAVSGPVTVGDPLTLLIHMKSEKAGYDILVKNCVAHNGGQQKMQLIDSNGCVVNERFISPFRGTYSDNELKHVTLYSYLKAFRFTGSPVLYLECEVHMCQSACPPQMCYWRRLSKRSANETLSGGNSLDGGDQFELGAGGQPTESIATTTTSTTTTGKPAVARGGRRAARKLKADEKAAGKEENLSDSVSLFQALEVRQERDENLLARSAFRQATNRVGDSLDADEIVSAAAQNAAQQMCYRRAEIFAFLLTVGSILLAAISVTVGCCLRASSLRSAHKRCRRQRQLASCYASNATLCQPPPRCSLGSAAAFASLSSPASSSTGSSASTSTSLPRPPSPSASSLGLKSVESCYYAQSGQSFPATRFR